MTEQAPPAGQKAGRKGKSMEKIVLTEQEKEIVEAMGHELYTVEYLEQWINRNDNVFVNAVAALNAIAAKGYYEAVKKAIKLIKG